MLLASVFVTAKSLLLEIAVMDLNFLINKIKSLYDKLECSTLEYKLPVYVKNL